MPGNGDFLKYTKAGDKTLSHDLINFLIDSAKRQNDREPIGIHPNPSKNDQDPTRALILNNTGRDLDYLAVMGLDTSIIDPADNPDAFAQNVALKGVLPTLADHRGKFAIALHPVAQGAIALCAVGGVVPIKLAVGDVSHQWADVDAGVTDSLKTQANPGGAQILWKQNTGSMANQWAYVRIGQRIISDFFCKIAADFTVASATITARRCQGDGTLLPDVTDPQIFDLTGDGSTQSYCNLLAGAVVRYTPYAQPSGGPGSIGLLAPQGIAATTAYAVLQTNSGMNRTISDYVRGHG
jgi:hypothetical protein